MKKSMFINEASWVIGILFVCAAIVWVAAAGLAATKNYHHIPEDGVFIVMESPDIFILRDDIHELLDTLKAKGIYVITDSKIVATIHLEDR